MATENKTTDEQVDGAIKKFFKELFGDKKPAETVAFSEADAKELIESAVKPLNEKITSLETENAKLKTDVQAQAGSSKRGEIVSFCESMPGTVLPWMKNVGVIEFMEAISKGDDKIDVISFAEENGKEVEKKVEFTPLNWFKNFLTTLNKRPQVQFGESFGDIKLTGNGQDVLDPQSVEDRKALRAAMGVKEPAAAS